MRTFDNNLKLNILSVIFIFVVIFGNFSIVDTHVIGIVPTYYRVIIPIIYISIILKLLQEKKTIRDIDFSIKSYYFVIIIWIVYGVLTLIFSPYSNISIGFKEIMALILGLLSVSIAIYLCYNNKFNILILAIKIAMTILLLIGIVEIFTGMHLSTSILRDPEYIERINQLYVNKDILEYINYNATGIFYNQNDYCACISIFCPVFLFNKGNNSLKASISYSLIGITFLILLIDDAWICIISLFIGIFTYLVISRAQIRTYAIILSMILILRRFGEKIIGFIISVLYRCFENEIFNHLIMMSNIESAVSAQVENAGNNQGSMFYRMNTYIESIKEMFVHSKGLGLGGGSYSNYFMPIAEQRHMMSNPHSLWVEILTQYGLIIFALFIVILSFLLIRLFKVYKTTKKIEYVLIISLGICFAFASFAPSSFLQNSYYWIIIGLGFGMINCKDYKPLNEKI